MLLTRPAFWSGHNGSPSSLKAETDTPPPASSSMNIGAVVPGNVAAPPASWWAVQSTVPSGNLPSTTRRVIEALRSSSVHPRITAVMRWQFTPTRVDGQPVAVRMTVTCNFNLK